MPSTSTMEPSFGDPTTVAEALALAARLEARNDNGYATPVQPYEVRRLVGAVRLVAAQVPTLMAAEQLPAVVAEQVGEIAEAALQAAFGEIAKRLGSLGYEVSGDFSPGEVLALDAAFAGYVHAMALNNEAIAALSEGGEQVG